MMKFEQLTAAAACAIALMAASVQSAKGQASPQSFQATNFLASTVNLTTYPTNGIGTNTGRLINVANYDRTGFYFSGYVTTVGTATVTLVRSPFTVAGSYTALSNTMESVSQKTLTIPMPATGPFNWTTNLEPEFIRPAIQLGINSMTNAAGVITNLDTGITKKQIPIGTK